MPLGESFSNLGQMLMQASRAMSNIEATEMAIASQRADTENLNAMYMEYLNTVDTYKQQYGNSLTSTSIKRRAYKEVLDKWQGSGIAVQQFNSLVAQSAQVAEFQTQIDDYISLAQKAGFNVTASELEDPATRDYYIKVLDDMKRVRDLEFKDNLTDTEATLYYDNMIQGYNAGLATQLDKVNQVISQASIGVVDPQSALVSINSFFDAQEAKLDELINTLNSKGKEAVGTKVLERKMKLQDMRASYLTDANNLMTARARTSTTLTEEEQAKEDAYVKTLDRKIKVKKALILNNVTDDPDGLEAFEIASVYEATGMQPPPEVQTKIYDLTSKALKNNKDVFNNINEASRLAYENEPEFNVIETFVNKNDQSPKALMQVIDASSRIFRDVANYEKIIQDKTMTDQEKLEAFRQLNVKLRALGFNDTFMKLSDYLQNAYIKNPSDSSLRTLMSFIERYKMAEAEYQEQKRIIAEEQQKLQNKKQRPIPSRRR